jgi:hypothetical protein
MMFAGVRNPGPGSSRIVLVGLEQRLDVGQQGRQRSGGAKHGKIGGVDGRGGATGCGDVEDRVESVGLTGNVRGTPSFLLGDRPAL